MKEYFDIFKNMELFVGINDDDIFPLLGCLSVRELCFQKGQTIFSAGESIAAFGIVLSGDVQVVQDDYLGSRAILAQFCAGSLVGESFAFSQVAALPVSVIAVSDCSILLMDSQKLTMPCERACGSHSALIKNMLSIVTQKNIILTEKISFISKRTTREKLIAYLSATSIHAHSRVFSIPFNRQELADFLCVERSAMSAELSELQKDGIIRYHKNDFELISDYRV